MDAVDNRTNIRDFLTSRRARVTPEQAGLPAYTGLRRVAGLRREEVAVLAGVSVDYYTRLERGNLTGVSESVLHAVAQALQLDDAERDHLFDMARAANAIPRGRRRHSPAGLRPSVQRVLDAITAAPAWVHNDRLDFLGGQPARLRPLLGDVHRPGPPCEQRPLHVPEPAITGLLPASWEQIADNTVAILRGAAGRDPYDENLTRLIGELSTRSEDFRTRWAAHNVRLHRTGMKRVHHPAVGDLDLTYEAMELPADPGLTMFTYTAEPGTPSEDGLKLLASWAATQDVAVPPPIQAIPRSSRNARTGHAVTVGLQRRLVLIPCGFEVFDARQRARVIAASTMALVSAVIVRNFAIAAGGARQRWDRGRRRSSRSGSMPRAMRAQGPL